MSKRSHSLILLCASWNLFYLAVSAYVDTPVLRVGRMASASGLAVPSEILLPLFLWLVHGLARRRYAAWMIALGPSVWFGFSIFSWLGLFLGGGPDLIVSRSFLNTIGAIGVPLNLLMGFLLIHFREFFAPDIWERSPHDDQAS